MSPLASDTDMVDAIPFGIWVDEQIKHGGQRRLADQLGVSESWLHKGAWRRRLTVERHVVEDALHRADVGWWEVYDQDNPDHEQTREVWCAPCNDTVTTLNGVCPWCESHVAPSFGLATVAAPAFVVPAGRLRERQGQLAKGQSGFGPVCGCGGRKSKQARLCKTCWTTAGRPGVGGKGTPRPALRGPYGVSEEQLADVRRVYDKEQVSLREIARRIHLQTYGYSTPTSLGEALYRAFRNRGWPLRSQADATRLRNWKHGRKKRAQTPEQQNEYRRWLADQRGWTAVQGPGNTVCTGKRLTSPGRGRSCLRPAMDGSPYCYSHDPARAAERDEHLAGARARVDGTPAEVLARARAAKKPSGPRGGGVA